MSPPAASTSATAGRPLPPAQDAAACAEEIESLLQGTVPACKERRILDVLEQCEAPVLNDVLRQVDLHRLVRGVDDHLIGADNRTELLDLITRQHVTDLDVEVKAGLVTALQDGPTRHGEEIAIRNIFLATEGDALTELKNRIDAGGDAHDAEGLLFHDIDDPTLRDEILGHIAVQAEPVKGLKVVSDIDDTFVCSLHDKRYPKGTVYPGVRQLYRELDAADGRAGDLTFITARPTEPTGITENRTHATLRRRGAPEASVITGTFSGLLSHERMATTKLEGLWRYRDVFPEYDALLIGDSGQGDIEFAFRALNSEGTEVPAALIHDVVGISQEERDELRDQDVILFDTYVDAAVEAYDKGLLSLEAVERVAAAAQDDLAAVDFKSDGQRLAREVETERALERVRELGRHSRV